MGSYDGRWQTVKVDIEDGIAWVTLNRPEKRNAMSPTLNREMVEVLETLEQDASAGVLVLTGAGEAWTAGMDLKEYFRETDAGPEILQEKIRREASQWQWKLLRMYAKPTIAMVNGWCFGGGFSPLVACDLAITANEATFGLSEINWGIPPGVPRDQLREVTTALARELLDKNPVVLRAAKVGFKRCRELTWEQNEDYLYAKLDQSRLQDPEGGREQGMKQFLDDKSIKPGLQTYKR